MPQMKPRHFSARPLRIETRHLSTDDLRSILSLQPHVRPSIAPVDVHAIALNPNHETVAGDRRVPMTHDFDVLFIERRCDLLSRTPPACGPDEVDRPWVSLCSTHG